MIVPARQLARRRSTRTVYQSFPRHVLAGACTFQGPGSSGNWSSAIRALLRMPSRALERRPASSAHDQLAGVRVLPARVVAQPSSTGRSVAQSRPRRRVPERRAAGAAARPARRRRTPDRRRGRSFPARRRRAAAAARRSRRPCAAGAATISPGRRLVGRGRAAHRRQDIGVAQRAHPSAPLRRAMGMFAKPTAFSADIKKSPEPSPVNTRPVRFAPCAAGASPTSRSRASGSPNPGTGRPQAASRRGARPSCRARSARSTRAAGRTPRS